MGENFVAALEAEISSLREALEHDVRYVRLRELERIRELYRNTQEQNGSNLGGGSDMNTLPASAAAMARRAKRISADRQRALEAARLYLLNKSGPVTTAEVYDHIISLGIPIAGEEPRNNLSAMLSQSDVFHSNGRLGWTLNEDLRDDLPDPPASEKTPPVLGPGTPRYADLDDDIPF